MSIYTAFERELYKQVVADVRLHDPSVKLREAWVYKVGPDHWEFHYGKFYWHGPADSAYEARAKGWSSWLSSQGVEGYAREDIR